MAAPPSSPPLSAGGDSDGSTDDSFVALQRQFEATFSASPDSDAVILAQRKVDDDSLGRDELAVETPLSTGRLAGPTTASADASPDPIWTPPASPDRRTRSSSAEEGGDGDGTAAGPAAASPPLPSGSGVSAALESLHVKLERARGDLVARETTLQWRQESLHQRCDSRTQTCSLPPTHPSFLCVLRGLRHRCVCWWLLLCDCATVRGVWPLAHGREAELAVSVADNERRLSGQLRPASEREEELEAWTEEVSLKGEALDALVSQD